jgi:hypothetical protein
LKAKIASFTDLWVGYDTGTQSRSVTVPHE